MAPLMTGSTSSGNRSRATAQVPTAMCASASGVIVAFTPTSPTTRMLCGKMPSGWLSGSTNTPASVSTSCLASSRSMGRK